MAKPSQNQNGRSKPENRSLMSRQFKGIRMRKWGKWVSEIRMPKSTGRLWLGSYDTPEKAARAYDFAVYCLRGSKAKLNFPSILPEIPYASSLSPPQIQASAAKFAAEEFRQPSEDDAAFSASFRSVQKHSQRSQPGSEAFSFSGSGSEAEWRNEGQEIWLEHGPQFWDSVLLECLESGNPLNLDDFPPLDESMDYFGVLI